MGTFKDKVKYGYWFIRKGYYGQFFNELKESVIKGAEQSSIDWCKSNSISQSEFFKQLEIKPKSLKTDFPKYLNFAKEQEKHCPYNMGVGSPINLLYNLIIALKPQYVVESGVAYGYSTLAILLGFKDRDDAHLWSIDMPYPNLGNEEYIGCIVSENLKKNWTLIQKPDISGVPAATNECHLIDLFHYDSDSRYNARMQTFKTVWHALKMGGHLVCVDVQFNNAFKDFAEYAGRDPKVISYRNRYIGIIRK